jgi:hypothetical protein
MSGAQAEVIALFSRPRFHDAMSKPTVLFTTLCLLALLPANPCRAQQAAAARSPAEQILHRFDPSLLIPFSNEVVQELKLNEAQKMRVKKLLLSLPPHPAGKDRHRLKHQTLAVLTQNQRNRLEELTLQYRGALASFQIPEVANTLGLNAEQKQRLEVIRFLLRSGAQNLIDYEKTLYGPAQPRGRFLSQLRHSSDCLAESVLVPAQMMKWREMQGKPLSPRPADWD